MNAARPPTNILVASDSPTDAALVKRLLSDRFERIHLSTDPDKSIADFDRWMPGVVILAFDALEKAERFYLGLYRFSDKIHTQAHRTVILCDKDEVLRVSELCMKRYFDDYVLFWPLNHDAPRLPMSVHQALDELAALQSGAPTVAEFAAQARRLAELEAMLNHQTELGGRHIETASKAMDHAQEDLGAALGALSQRLSHGAMQEAAPSLRVQTLEHEISRFKQEDLSNLFRTAAASVQPLRKWNEDFRQGYASHVGSIRALGAMAERIRPKVLVVDDDEMQRNLIARLLEHEDYELSFAADGAQALSLMRTYAPDVILMDVLMPSIDGIETTRRLKSIPHLARIPVVMITGKSEGTTVVDCLKAGASDFVVKPFERSALIAKIARHAWPARPAAPPSAEVRGEGDNRA